MGCVASMPTATKGSFSKSKTSKVGGKTCSVSEPLLPSANLAVCRGLVSPDSGVICALPLSQADSVATNGLPVTAVSKASLRMTIA